jgi:outer membrane protein assembly factor BamB
LKRFAGILVSFLAAVELLLQVRAAAAQEVNAGGGRAAAMRSDQTPLGSPMFYPSPQHPLGWRGDGTGNYAGAQPATRWSDKLNVAWRTEVGEGHSSPVVVGDRVLITSEPDLLVCLDAASGKVLWRKAQKIADLPAELHAEAPPPGPPSQWAGYATPVPASDGKSIWTVFGSGIVACYDLGGNRRWMSWYEARRSPNYGRTCSPVLVGARLLVHFGPLLCLDAATGKLLWKNDKAKATYGTPAAARIGDTDVAVTPKGDLVRVADGKLLASGLGSSFYPSPVIQGRIVYFIDHAITAVELPAAVGDSIEPKELWSEDLAGEFYASPLIRTGRIYTVDRLANYYVIDAASGKTLLTKALSLPSAGRGAGPSMYASICRAGDRLWVGNNAGESLLLEPGEQAAVIATNALPEGADGTPAFSGPRMFVRGGKWLYCIASAGGS